MLKKLFNERGIFKKFLLTYVLLLILFLIAFLSVYSIMISSITEYDRNNLYTSAARSNEMLSQQMKNVHTVCQQIRNGADESFTKYLSDNQNFKNDRGDFSMAKKEMTEKLSVYDMSSQIIDEIFLFSATDNNVVSSMGYINLDVLYGSMIKFDDLDMNQFRTNYLNGPKYSEISPLIKINKAGKVQEVFLYVESYPNDYFDNPTSYIVISLDFNEIKQIMGYDTGNPEQCLFLYNTNREQIFPVEKSDMISESDDDIYEINNKRYIAFSFENETGINVLSGNLYNSAIKNTIRTKLLVIIILFVAFLIGSVLSIYFAKSSTKPIKNLTKKIENFGGSGINSDNEFIYLSTAIDSICNDISAIKSEFDKEIPVIINDFVNSLLIAEEVTNDRILQISKNLNIDISGSSFAVLLARIVSDDKQYNDTKTRRSIQKSISEEYKSRFKCLTCIYGTDTVAIVFMFDDTNTSENVLRIENVTYAISEKLFETLGIKLKYAMGSFYDTINDVCYSYSMALANLNNGTEIEYRHTVWCVQSNNYVSWYYYPAEIESRLKNAFRNKDVAETEHILNVIYNENCVNRVLVKNTMKLLYANMKITLYNLIQQYCHDISDAEMRNMLDGVDEENGPDVFFENIKQVYKNAIEEKNDISLKQQILNYVDSAALKAEFDRQAFAEHFYISPDYVTKFFKDSTGMGFTKYATKVKIEKACEMLLDTKNSIEQIAEAVGYNSALSFRRAFKNYTGISPSEFRHRKTEDSFISEDINN